MIIHSKNLIVNTEDFPAIYITRSNVNCDKYSVVFQSKFDADVNISITDLEYSIAVEILSDMPEDVISEGAVEIVRCEYCKYAFRHPLGYIYCHRDGKNAYEMIFRKDSFCSYGERENKKDFGNRSK